MKNIKIVCRDIIILGYIVSWYIFFGDGKWFTVPIFLAFICAIFGVCGGSIVLFAGITRFHAARLKERRVRWYNSPSIALGASFLTVGFLPVTLVFRFIISDSRMEGHIELYSTGVICFFLLLFLMFAFVFRHREEY